MPERSVERTGTVIIRNGVKLCAACRSLGCEHIIGGKDVEEVYISREDCQCCGPDPEPIGDDFGI